MGGDFDSLGNLYVANNNTGIITKIDTTGVTTSFVTLGNVTGIVINKQNELFVTSYEKNIVYKIMPNGDNEIWIKGNGLNGPVGIAFDEDENLYVGNYLDARLFKIDKDKTVTELSSSLDSSGYITYANNFIYATGRNTNKIYAIPTNGGSAKELEGSSEVGFNFPNGITPNEDGSILYVSNWRDNKIIAIENLSDVAPTMITAQDDVAQVQENSEVVIDILSNDIVGDAAIDPATVTLVIIAQSGETTVDDSNGSITYKPNASFSGTDSIVYTINDVKGISSNEARVNITVTTTTVNQQPAPTVEKKSSSGGTISYTVLMLLLLRVLKRASNNLNH